MSGRLQAVRRWGDRWVGRFAVTRDLFRFLWERGLFWMIPLVVVLLFLAILVVVGQQTAVPFIYAIF